MLFISVMKDNKLKTKSSIAYEMIREMILNGTALPGTRLILMDLENELNVGRGPIRDALLLLENSGLVQNIPYKGAIVMLPPSLQEMELIYEQRKHIESALAREALLKANNKDLDKLNKIASEMEKRSKEENYFFHLDRNFHRVLYSISNMPHLQAIVEHLMDFVQIFLTDRKYSEEQIEIVNKQHKIIIQAIQKKDVKLLQKTIEENIMIGLEFVRDEMQHYIRK